MRLGLPAAFLLAGSAMLLGACDREQDDLRAYIERINDRPGRSLEPLPEIQEFERYAYAPAERREPFVPLRQERRRERVDTGPRPDEQRARGVLEAYPLDALKMVGLVERGGRRYALIRDPDRIIHRVPVGTYAGENHGRIVSIEPRRVQLIELVPDGFGGWTERSAELPMDDDARG